MFFLLIAIRENMNITEKDIELHSSVLLKISYKIKKIKLSLFTFLY